MSDLQTKLGGGINKIQDSLQQGKQKLQIAQEISQYNKLISETAEKRAEVIFKLGETIYRKIRSGEIQDSDLHNIGKEVVEYDQTIYKAQVMLAQLKMKTEHNSSCSGCGTSLTSDDKFCGSCGQKVERVEVTEVAEMAACPTCEEQVPVNGAFCSCCGNRLAG
ncbi:zinc ribbon domain-containing protein [Bacillus sp. 31A1R]|uniref:Zinc ribbon domain-containing protein n=1 Tax=Robertmurraya mangrovi TaxID=3098077 RepID=A0ABU5IXZ1_9BACI|nr:zinc ribbon domain-containing protein [Bacillus sp. 31A1R]MDZ5472038.1 zinc ribbon domain-containing protein [Bacillus sp. 31A1R]